MALKTKYSPLQHFSFNNVLTSFVELSPPNKIASLVIFGLGLLLVVFLPLSLVSSKINSLKKEILSAQKGFTQVADKVVEYQTMRQRMTALEERFGRSSGGSLSSKVENIAKQSGLTIDQVREKSPQETDFLEINAIEVKLAGVSLQQLIEFLVNLQNDKSTPMQVRKLQIKPRYANRQQLEVSFELATFALKKEG